MDLGSVYLDRAAAASDDKDAASLARQAVAHFRRALRCAQPPPPVTHFLLGRALMGFCEVDEGKRELQAFLDSPGDYRQYCWKAKELLQQRPWNLTEEQQRWYSEGTARCDAPRLCRESPKSDSERLRIQEGIDLLDHLLKERPDHWPTWWITGKGAQAVGNHAGAYERFQKAFMLNPDHPDMGREYGAECIALGKAAEAVAATQRALEDDPTDTGLQANLALALLISGNVDGSEQTAAAAFERSPEDKITGDLLDFVRQVKAGKQPCPTRWPR
jgi:tetratricopeptide (TPR) repeat protein